MHRGTEGLSAWAGCGTGWGVRERLAALGMDVAAPNSPQEFAGLVKGELGRWSAMLKTLGLRVD